MRTCSDKDFSRDRLRHRVVARPFDSRFSGRQVLLQYLTGVSTFSWEWQPLFAPALGPGRSFDRDPTSVCSYG